jgi:hypothetical protein
MEIDIAHFETLAQIEKSFSDYLAFIGQYAMDLNDYELTYTIKDVPMLGYFEFSVHYNKTNDLKVKYSFHNEDYQFESISQTFSPLIHEFSNDLLSKLTWFKGFLMGFLKYYLSTEILAKVQPKLIDPIFEQLIALNIEATTLTQKNNKPIKYCELETWYKKDILLRDFAIEVSNPANVIKNCNRVFIFYQKTIGSNEKPFGPLLLAQISLLPKHVFSLYSSSDKNPKAIMTLEDPSEFLHDILADFVLSSDIKYENDETSFKSLWLNASALTRMYVENNVLIFQFENRNRLLIPGKNTDNSNLRIMKFDIPDYNELKSIRLKVHNKPYSYVISHIIPSTYSDECLDCNTRIETYMSPQFAYDIEFLTINVDKKDITKLMISRKDKFFFFENDLYILNIFRNNLFTDYSNPFGFTNSEPSIQQLTTKNRSFSLYFTKLPSEKQKKIYDLIRRMFFENYLPFDMSSNLLLIFKKEIASSNEVDITNISSVWDKSNVLFSLKAKLIYKNIGFVCYIALNYRKGQPQCKVIVFDHQKLPFFETDTDYNKLGSLIEEIKRKFLSTIKINSSSSDFFIPLTYCTIVFHQRYREMKFEVEVGKSFPPEVANNTWINDVKMLRKGLTADSLANIPQITKNNQIEIKELEAHYSNEKLIGIAINGLVWDCSSIVMEEKESTNNLSDDLTYVLGEPTVSRNRWDVKFLIERLISASDLSLSTSNKMIETTDRYEIRVLDAALTISELSIKAGDVISYREPYDLKLEKKKVVKKVLISSDKYKLDVQFEDSTGYHFEVKNLVQQFDKTTIQLNVQYILSAKDLSPENHEMLLVIFTDGIELYQSFFKLNEPPYKTLGCCPMTIFDDNLIEAITSIGSNEAIIQQSLKRVKLIVDQTYPISVRRKEASLVKNPYNALLSPSESSDTRSMKLYAILPNTAPATQLELESWAMEIAINFQTKFVVEE